jgi:hypothetical protein
LEGQLAEEYGLNQDEFWRIPTQAAAYLC